jgi:L-fuculokinase
MKVTAIFDIGKTNKKFFLFDDNFREVHKEYISFEEIEDDDGYPADDLPAVQSWMREVLDKAMANKKYDIRAVNFSTYGASLVHLDRYGKPLTPLYNYTKPLPEETLRPFYTRYGDSLTIASETASPASGMLNSGFQLYWLKQAKPEIFQRIRHSLHFPQYLSYLFTGIPVSDFTSVGCHTSLWHFAKNDYHDWVYAEQIDRLLPPIVSTGASVNILYGGKRIRAGVGIHDSSAALLPYLLAEKKPFLLISTGTWSISLNPHSEEILTTEDLQNDCLNYMRIDGKPVKASRLFLGNEFEIQVKKLCAHFGKPFGYHRTVKFNKKIYRALTGDRQPKFCFESLRLSGPQPESTQLSGFPDFETAFHRLMMELMDLQVESARRAIGNSVIKKIYVDGGFADNEIFVKLASLHFKDYKLRTTQSPLGSALGAAMVISDKKVRPEFLKEHYAVRKHEPLILQK